MGEHSVADPAPLREFPRSGMADAQEGDRRPLVDPALRRPWSGLRLRKQDWAGFLSGSAVFWSLIALVRRRVRVVLALLGVATVAEVAGRIWSRRDPGPLPASLRWILHMPHPRGPLRRALDPRPGERVLEIGPGLGQYAVDVAMSVRPDGRVDVVDVQQDMLDATMRLAERKRADNVNPALGDASRRLPFADGTFDAAYLNSVLGEIPDQRRALLEICRVLKPAGRLVVGEIASDPDYVSLRRLRALASSAGFRFERQEGPTLAYFARLVVA